MIKKKDDKITPIHSDMIIGYNTDSFDWWTKFSYTDPSTGDVLKNINIEITTLSSIISKYNSMHN